MSTAPLGDDHRDEPLLERASLPRRGLLILLPFAFVGALGFAWPALALVQQRSTTEVIAQRVPYDGGLGSLLKRQDLPTDALLLLEAEHRRLLREVARFGGITTEDAAKAAQWVQRFGGERPR